MESRIHATVRLVPVLAFTCMDFQLGTSTRFGISQSFGCQQFSVWRLRIFANGSNVSASLAAREIS